MALSSVWKRSQDKGKATASPEAADSARGSGLAAQLLRSISLPPERERLLREGLEEGLEFYEDWNKSRLELALSSFDREMVKALYEIIFLLHVNDQRVAELKYTVAYIESVGGVPRQKEREETANLFVDGAPYGVQGIEQLPPAIRDDFWAYIGSEFHIDQRTAGYPRHRPITSLHSIGSIGTVGHKSGTSDLDLQVIFDLDPLPEQPELLSDGELRDALLHERDFWAKALARRKKLTPDKLRNPQLLQKLRAAADGEIAKNYPNLRKYLLTDERDYRRDFGGASGPALRIQCLQELINLIKRSSKVKQQTELKTQEKALRERIERLQVYIAGKFPSAEVYMFPMSVDDYRRGRYSSTLEFKESSGSAYELILNYETLMPGIQFTPVVPSFFIFRAEINNNSVIFNQLHDYIRFGVMDLYAPVRDRLVNLGAAPKMTTKYIARHSGAIYWEAFKASSGNLPKAILNLLRYEMLLDERFLVTVIQLITNPRCLDSGVTPRPEEQKGFGPRKEAGEDRGMAPWNLMGLESDHPMLLRDPWWLRYKALKIGFAEEKGVSGLEPEERRRVSKIIDLAFSLHVRISDIFTKPGDRREFKTHRERVLVDFFGRAFPEGSSERDHMQRIFAGDVYAVNAFETEMRKLFKSCLERVRNKIAAFDLPEDKINKDEFDLWHHYYKSNFDGRPNMVERSIMNHLKVPRGRLQMGFRPGKGWFFKSLQKESGVGKRFDTFGILDHLPGDVMLQENVGFLGGLAHCIINGYYGILNKGTLKESKTALVFDGKYLDLGHSIHNTLAFVRPDQVDRILQKILDHFPFQEYDYLDVIRAERKVADCFIFINLWQFGRLSILSRDNLRSYYYDEYDVEGAFAQAKALSMDGERLARLDSLHTALGDFFDTRKILVDSVNLAVWINPNSIETTHGASQIVRKEDDLSELFLNVIRERHG